MAASSTVTSRGSWSKQAIRLAPAKVDSRSGEHRSLTRSGPRSRYACTYTSYRACQSHWISPHFTCIHVFCFVVNRRATHVPDLSICFRRHNTFMSFSPDWCCARAVIGIFSATSRHWRAPVRHRAAPPNARENAQPDNIRIGIYQISFSIRASNTRMLSEMAAVPYPGKQHL